MALEPILSSCSAYLCVQNSRSDMPSYKQHKANHTQIIEDGRKTFHIWRDGDNATVYEKG